MPAPFTDRQIEIMRHELRDLYVRQNKPLGEIAKLWGMSEQGVYCRLKRCNISIEPWKKAGYLNTLKEVTIPAHSKELAEFIGIMLGDGHITPTQIWVTSHALDDRDYHVYMKALIRDLFKVEVKGRPKIKYNAIECYAASVRIVKFLKEMGLVQNKVKMQVVIPGWIFEKSEYQKACLKGLIDTDGSVYKLRYGIQISFKNRSRPLLEGVRELFIRNGFHPSKISGYAVYLTRRKELDRYFLEVGTSNAKHLYRYLKFNLGR